MPKTFEKAPDEVENRVRDLLQIHYEEHWNVGIKIDLIFVRNDTGQPLSHQGYPAAAVVRIIPLKDRSMDRGDAEIVIDAEGYEGMDDPQRDALLDHELYHLVLAKDKDMKVKLDDLGRPMLRMRKHDHQVGWFREIAVRHGRNSMECRQAKLIYDKHAQAYWPQLLSGSSGALSEGSVTISGGGKTVEMTSEQFTAAAEGMKATRRKKKTTP